MPVPTNNKQVNHLFEWVITCPGFLPDCLRLWSPSENLAKGKVSFNWGPEHQSAFTQMKKEIKKHSHIGLLQSKEVNCIKNWCKDKRFRHMLASRRKTSLLCQQSINRCTAGICSYWIRILCSCLGNGKISSFQATLFWKWIRSP